jgi:phosphoribosyl-AMP cyclohydrolase
MRSRSWDSFGVMDSTAPTGPMGLSLGDLSAGLTDRVVASSREREPGATGILVHGSYATGRARPDSDLDLAIFVSGPPTVHYRTWFEERKGQLPLHVSARSDLTVEIWKQEAMTPADWALGIPVELAHVWLWPGDGYLRNTLGDNPVVRKPGAAPEVEDMVDALLKARLAVVTGDSIGLRLAAQDAVRFAAPCVVALNTPERARDPRSALTTILGLPVAPLGWRDDVVTCLGLSSRGDHDVAAAGERLVRGVLRLLRETDPYVDPQPDIARYLIDGTFEKILTT